MRNFVCVWTGNKYPESYVSILYASLKRKTRVDTFYCITDNECNLDPGITVIKLTNSDQSWWNKLQIFNRSEEHTSELQSH